MKATEGLSLNFDPELLTFSQAQGYEALPGPLKLEEMSEEARTHIWNVFYSLIRSTADYGALGEDWDTILYEKHIWIDNLPLDKWHISVTDHIYEIRNAIKTLSFNRVLDLIQFVLRHPSCPDEFIDSMKEVFARQRLAYTIDDGPPPTIIPSVTARKGIRF